jgi:hypothetical protein
VTRIRTNVAVVIAVILLAGCGQQTRPGDAAPTRTPTETTGPVVVPLPDGFPAKFPPPPRGTPVESTHVIDAALTSGGLGTQHGSVIRRSVGYEYRTGGHIGLQRLLAHYRDALPAAGWTITQDQPLDPANPPGTRPATSPPADKHAPARHRLRAEGHGHTDVGLTIEPGRWTTTIRVDTTELDLLRTPYHAHPPSVDMPGWYAALPPPPAGLWRYRITIDHSRAGGQSHRIEYQDPHPPGPQERDHHPDMLLDHYRQALPGLGWIIGDLSGHAERPGVYGGVITHQISSLAIQGHQVTGTIQASQTTSQAGQWLSTRLTITIYTPPPPTPGGTHGR